MAKILGIITAVILAISAFVAYKNNTRLELEISERNARQSELAQSQERLKEAQEILRALPIEIEQVQTSAALKEEEQAALEEENKGFEDEIASKGSEIESNKRKLDGVREKIAKVGDIKSLAGKIKSIRFEMEELDQAISSKEANLASLATQTTAAQKEARRRQAQFDRMSKGESLPEMKTRISRIYPTWGFVTLADGNNAGVVGNSTLDVVRGDKVIGRLLVSAVESSSASASIIPDSIPVGKVLQVGDKVVPSEKKSNAKAAASN